jgi:hypothetical protein
MQNAEEDAEFRHSAFGSAFEALRLQQPPS